MQPLQDQVVIVTGSSAGLGREMALRLSEEGANVVLASRSVDKLRAIADEAPTETLVAQTDVSDAESVEQTLTEAIDTFGRVDTLVNNAAVGLLSLANEVRRLHEVSESEWDTVLDTNLKGPFLLTKAVVPHMLEQGRGNVVNITTGLGRAVFEIGDSAWGPYTTSKWGIEALTRITDVEYHDDGINANALDPGGRTESDFWTEETWPGDHEEMGTLPATVMNDAITLLAAQGPGGVSGESMDASEWEDELGDA